MTAKDSAGNQTPYEKVAVPREASHVHRQWLYRGRPGDTRKSVVWVCGHPFDLTEDESGVVELQRHED